jgi:hypothetical protein
MSEPRAQRTLVKSPPELWAEVSDAGTLARRLGELGDIRITRLEAETTVVWEGDRARGTVELEASGWGTKVTITASAVTEEAPTTAPPSAVEEEAEERTESVAPPGFEATPKAVAAPPRRRGFLARLLGRRERVEVEPVAVPAAPEPIAPPELEPDEDIVVTSAAMDDEQLEAALVAVLDDLGSAHHRPFSRG